MLFPPAQAERVEKLPQPLLIHRASVHQHRERQVLHDVQHWDQVIELVHKPDLPPPEDGQRLLVLRVDVLPVDIDLAACRAVDAAENVQKRGFAGAGRPDNREKFPLLHGEGDIVHGVHGVFAAAVDLGQVFDPHQFHKLSSR